MNKKLLKLLAVWSAGSLAIIGGEWLVAYFNQQQLLNTPTLSDSQATPDEMPSIDLNAESEDSYADLVERPLFLEGRKPVKEPPPENAAKPAMATAKFDWVLNGIYTSKKGWSVLLTHATPLKTRKENFRKVKLGEDLDGWKLLEIKEDRAIFSLDGEQKELLLRKAKPKTVPKPAAPPSPEDAQNAPAPTEGAPNETTPPPEDITPEAEMPDAENETNE